MTLQQELETLAVDIALEAGALALERREDGVAIASTKSTLADIVTEADREVETLIRTKLNAARPHDGFLGEESGNSTPRAESEITWVVDPIDGTVNYALGFPVYAVSIAAVTGGDDPETWIAQAGVVFNPATKELFQASRRHGARLNGHVIAVNRTVPPAGLLFSTGFTYDPSHRATELARLAAVLAHARDVRRSGAAALDLAYVAAGRLDAHFEIGLNPWDHAAGSLLVTEAGGHIAGGPGGRPGHDMTIAASAACFPLISDYLQTC